MPDIDWNIRAWNRNYRWAEQGEEWSTAWGGSAMQWYGTLLPRIHRFLPADTVLEIAPGYGRWTEYLKHWSTGQMIGIDLSQKCIDVCRERFKDDPKLSFHVNDGRSLEAAPKAGVDFIFSFDSLVHAEMDVLVHYLGELMRVMKPNGVAFLHHSNLGEHIDYFDRIARIPKGQRTLSRMGWIEKNHHNRGRTVTAAKFRRESELAGFSCVSQEIINWGTKRTIDALTILTPRGSKHEQPTAILKNPNFMNEAQNLKTLAGLYAPSASTFMSQEADP